MNSAHIRDLLAGNSPTLSFEFFPPKTKAAKKNLHATLDELANTNPDFVSVTYGAMGSTRDTTKEIVSEISSTKPFPAMAHLTCVGHAKKELLDLLDEYATAGVNNILALSGDPIEGENSNDEFKYAVELVELIRQHPHDFSIGVAAHPEVHPRSNDKAKDRKHLAQKLSLADFAITQFFFYSKHYFEMVQDLAELGVEKPVIAGVIPVISTDNVLRFSKMNEVEVNQDLMEKIDNTNDNVVNNSVNGEVKGGGNKNKFGDKKFNLAVDYAWELMEELLEGRSGSSAPGIHIYTLNQAVAGSELSSRMRKYRQK